MYRILIASNGYYYVQQEKFSGWTKVGGFFHSRIGAETLIRDLKNSEPIPRERVVGYY